MTKRYSCIIGVTDFIIYPFFCPFFYLPIHPSFLLSVSSFIHLFTQPGDQIIRVNGLIISESTHDEFVNLIKWKHSLTLTIKGICAHISHLPSYKQVLMTNTHYRNKTILLMYNISC